MKNQWLVMIGALAAVVIAVLLVAVLVMGRGAVSTRTSLQTPWGEPDLQGIWYDETATPLQRPAKFADKEFFTDAERAELDKQRAALLRFDKRAERGSPLDVAGVYNAVFLAVQKTGRRTSLIVEPPDGRIPPMTEEGRSEWSLTGAAVPQRRNWLGRTARIA